MAFSLLEDASTGMELVGFVRRGRRLWFLRHPLTRRFIRRIRRFEARYIMELDYEGRRRNNLYVDALIATVVSDPDPSFIRALMREMRITLRDKIEDWFGPYVAGMMRSRGFEYRSEPEYDYDYPKAIVVVIYYHSKEEARAPHLLEEEVELSV